MDIVNDLIRRRAACEQEIAEQERKIQEYERAYESLRRFDGAVDTAQSNFHNVNTVKLNRTSELSSITSRCRTAQLYLEGSQRTLNGFGAKIVGAAFTGLDVMIRLKLAEYRLKIQNCENRISSLERSIDSINSMIDTARILPGRRMRVGIRKKTFWKRTFAVFLASVCLWSAAGCTGAGTGMDREDEKVSTELTQRQRELLEEMGLPADYDKLTDTQKNADCRLIMINLPTLRRTRSRRSRRCFRIWRVNIRRNSVICLMQKRGLWRRSTWRHTQRREHRQMW